VGFVYQYGGCGIFANI
jgi:hypothetical protein